MIRITLSNDSLGKLTIKDAIGINDLKLTAKRSEQGDGVLFVVVLGVKLIKRGRRYLMRAFEFEGGIEANVGFLVEQYDPNTFQWLLYYNGRVDYNVNDLGEVDIEVAVTQVGPQVDLMNAFDRVVPLESTITPNGSILPALSTIGALPLHSKTIQRVANGKVTESSDQYFISAGQYILFSYPLTISEIEEAFQYTFAVVDFKPFEWVIVKEKGTYSFNLGMLNYLVDADPVVDGAFRWYLEVNGVPYELTRVMYATPFGVTAKVIYHFLTLDIFIDVGQSYRFYGQEVSANGHDCYINILTREQALASMSVPSALPDAANSQCYVSALTSIDPSTTKAVLIYEVVERIVKYHTNGQLAFKSTLLGRTDLGYAIDGSASLIVVTNGRAIRNSHTFALFPRATDLTWTLQDALDFLALRCIGWGFEYIAGVLTFVLEHKSYFFKQEVAVDLGKCFKPRRRLLSDKFYATVTIEYSAKIEKTEINSIDEFNTSRTFAFPNKNTKNELKLSTKVVVGGYLIETQRRLITSSEEGKFDGDIFAIDCVRDGSDYRPRKIEGFSSIVGIIDPSSGYNYNFAPTRLLTEYWKDTLATNTVRSLSKIMKFASGTGNYNMVAKKTTEPIAIDERGSIDLASAKPLWDNFEYLFEKEVKLTRDQMLVAIANPDKQWKFTDRKGVSYVGWVTVNPIEHDTNHNKATVKLLKGFLVESTEVPLIVIQLSCSINGLDDSEYTVTYATQPVISFSMSGPNQSQDDEAPVPQDGFNVSVVKTDNGGLATTHTTIQVLNTGTLLYEQVYLFGEAINFNFIVTEFLKDDVIIVGILEEGL